MPLITAPLAEPVTLAEAKACLRIDDDLTDQDALITSLIVNARQQAEHRTGRRFGMQTWERVLDAFPGWAILLPDPPVHAIVSIKYDDATAIERTLDPAAYRLRPYSEPAAIMPVTTWPTTLAEPGAVRIRYTCGVTATDADWASLRAWMLLSIGVWHRPSAVDSAPTYALPDDFWNGLLDPLRFYGTVTA